MRAPFKANVFVFVLAALTGETALMQTFTLNISWLVWSLLALLVAGVFAVVWPKSRAEGQVTAVQFFLLRWGHSLVWLSLSLSFLLRSQAAFAGSGLPDLLALAALPLYVGFLGVLVVKAVR